MIDHATDIAAMLTGFGQSATVGSTSAPVLIDTVDESELLRDGVSVIGANKTVTFLTGAFGDLTIGNPIVVGGETYAIRDMRSIDDGNVTRLYCSNDYVAGTELHWNTLVNTGPVDATADMEFTTADLSLAAGGDNIVMSCTLIVTGDYVGELQAQLSADGGLTWTDMANVVWPFEAPDDYSFPLIVEIALFAAATHLRYVLRNVEGTTGGIHLNLYVMGQSRT